MGTEFLAKNGEAFLIRQAVPGDAAELLRGIHSVLAEQSDFFLTQADEFHVELDQEQTWIQSHIDAENSVMFVALHGDDMIGWANLQGGRRIKQRHHATLGITVVEAWRGQGVGRALMEELLAWAAANPLLEKLKLEVVSTNAVALDLYRSLGFVEEGRHSRDWIKPDGTYQDLISMALFLDPSRA
jgi:RimJ/RimL family protein N-acetyltransferase